MTIYQKLTLQKRLANILFIGGIGGAVLFFYLANSLNGWLVFPGILDHARGGHRA